MQLPAALRNYAREARSAFAYAPIEVVLGVLLAITFSVAVRQRDGEEWWVHVAAGVALALPLVFAISVLRGRRIVSAALRWSASALVLAAVAAYAVWVFDADQAAEGWRWAALEAAAVLGLALVPVPGRGPRERVRQRVWAFDIELLLRIAGVGLYAALLFAALAGAVAAVSALFELTTPDHLYADLAGIVFFALVPWVVAIRDLLDLAPGARVLDLACGWGRHSVALAETGMDVTKVDLSETLLERAQRDAAEAGVEVEWVRADMREIGWNGEFHAVRSFFSSLGLFGTDEEGLRVLRAAHRALRPGGMLLLEVMHRDQVVAEYAERDRWETEDGTVVRVQREWDAVAGISHERLRWRRGRERGEKNHRIRVRSDTEWEAMLRAGGFAPLIWWGRWEGERFGRGSEQMSVLARAES